MYITDTYFVIQTRSDSNSLPFLTPQHRQGSLRDAEKFYDRYLATKVAVSLGFNEARIRKVEVSLED